MTPSDKQKLSDAFRKAVENSPHADRSLNGMFMPDKTPATPRKLMEITLSTPQLAEQFFAAAEKAMEQNNLTVDQLIEKSFKAPKL
jgi:hypothetical protein